MTSDSNPVASLFSMTLCTAVRKPLRLARPVSGSLRASHARRSSNCLRSVMSDTEHTTLALSAPSESPMGRELTESHWSLPCPSRTPMTTLVVASRRCRAIVSGSPAAGNGAPSSRWALRPPVRIWSPRPVCRRAPRIRVAESLAAATAPSRSITTTPSSRAATAAA